MKIGKLLFFAGLTYAGYTVFFKEDKNLNGLSGLGSLDGFFDDAKDLITLRKMYFDYVKEYHPDRHPEASEKEKERLTDVMQRLNNEYDKLVKILPKEAGKNFESAEDQTKEQQISEAYKDLINEVLKFDLIKVELIGVWVWVSGNTYPIRKELKAAGFMFAPKKKMWYWRPEDKKMKYKGKTKDIEEIRNKYGTVEIKRSSDNEPKRLYGIGELNNKLLNSLNALQILIDG